MNVGKISPVISGNYKVSKAQKVQNASSNSISLNTNLMDKNVANALKAQVAFGSTKGVVEGEVEGKTAVSATLNGETRIKNNLLYSIQGYDIASVQEGDKRKIMILKDNKKIITGYIANDLDPQTEIKFNAAKFNPEIKITKGDSTIQLFEGSEIADSEGKFEFVYPGKYSTYDAAKKGSKSNNISFTGFYASVLCEKDATVDAVNKQKNDQFTVSGQYSEEMLNDDPTVVGLMGGFGTRFSNISKEHSNKPAFVMPNNQSLVGAAFDLAKNAERLDSIEKVTYLNQISDKNPSLTKSLVEPGDEVINMKAFNSDGGAVIHSVLNKAIPSDRPLVILNADTITNVDVSQVYHKLKTLKNAALVIPSYPVSETRAKSFGLMAAGTIADEVGSRELTSFVEKPKNPAKEAKGAMIKDKTVNGEQAYSGNPGIYLFSDVVLNNLDTILPVAEEIALTKKQDTARAKGEEIPTKLKDPFSDSTFLGNAFVPAIVQLCQEGRLVDEDGNKMKSYVVPMNTAVGTEAVWDDVGSAEAFIKNCQDIAYETEAHGTNGANKYYGIKRLRDFHGSTGLYTGVVYASVQDRANFEEKYADDFEIKGNAFITCK